MLSLGDVIHLVHSYNPRFPGVVVNQNLNDTTGRSWAFHLQKHYPCLLVIRQVMRLWCFVIFKPVSRR